MLYASTLRNSDLAANLITIEGDPALATFSGTSAVWTPRDTLSGLLYNGLIGPSAFVPATAADSPIMQGLSGISLADWQNYLGLILGPYPSLPNPGTAFGKQVQKSVTSFDWKFWLVSIFLALLGLIFVLGGVLSFR